MRRTLLIALGALLPSACAMAPGPTSAPAAAEAPASPPPAASLAALAPAAVAPTPAAPPRLAAPWRIAHVPGRATASSGVAGLAVDGKGETEWNPREFVAPGKPQWLALPLQAPATGELAVSWHGHAMHYVNYDYGRPRTYDVEVSADSADGSGGTWKRVAHVDDNPVRSRAATFSAPGARWVRLVFTTAWSGSSKEPFLREVAVHERTGPGAPDVWLVLGDSTTSVGLDPASAPYFAGFVTAKHPDRHPIMLSGGTGGDTSANLAARLDVALPTLPPGSVVGLCYGSNDAKFGVDVEVYRRNLQAGIDRIAKAGHRPLLAVLPWSMNGNIKNYARICREVAAANDLPPGPDFHAYFGAHLEEMEFDRVHPNPLGVKAMQQLWADAAGFRYED